MKLFIFKTIKKITNILLEFKLSRFIFFAIFEEVSNFKTDVTNLKNKNKEFSFYTPNYLSRYRAKSLYLKEPDTIEWLDSFKDNSVFFDIGSNVGLYSIYSAKLKNSKVYSFEPSVFNLDLLAKNIYLNKLEDKITIIPLPVNDQKKISFFNFTDTGKGAAFSTFDKNYDHNGNDLNTEFKFKVISSSLDDIIKDFYIEKPEYIKIDVDGIEHLILKGSTGILKNVRSILIEVNDNFKYQKQEIINILQQNNFEKQINPKFSQESIIKNEIWNNKLLK
jgi:FkbM family methyltransferase|tara:strand:+ start:11328 stop:12161 length:834 start_codon:yes stop_codon:yes gene_type:complete